MTQKIEVNCDEEGETYICWGTMDKRKALKYIKDFLINDCGIDEEFLPTLDDLYLNPLWCGKGEGSGGDEWYWWANPPKDAKYLGTYWRYDL